VLCVTCVLQQHSRGPGVQIEEVGSDEDASGHQVASGQPYVEEASDEEGGWRFSMKLANLYSPPETRVSEHFRKSGFACLRWLLRRMPEYALLCTHSA